PNGFGGGALILSASGYIVVNGTISANGVAVTEAGSGGSVYIRAKSVLGNGVIQANGGVAGVSWGGGGGGRVSVVMSTATSFGSLQITASGGSGNNDGAAGTVYLEDANDGTSNGALI